MSGNRNGSIKTAARRIGVSLAEYQARQAAGEKWCIRCHEWRAITQFGADRSRGDGLKSACRTHDARRSAEPGKPERRQRAIQGQRWCRGCRAWLPITEVSTQGVCRPCAAAAARKYYGGPAGSVIRARVSARRRSLDPIPPWWRAEHFATFNGLCAYGCGASAEALDHIWPVARGGKSTPGNLAPACTSCNSSKNDRDPAPWIERGFAALPVSWANLAALAMEHNTDEWLGGLINV